MATYRMIERKKEQRGSDPQKINYFPSVMNSDEVQIHQGFL